MATIGIDFGTTKTLVAQWDAERQYPRTIRLGTGHDELPTAIHVDVSQEMLFGDDAEDYREVEPEGYLRHLKRQMDRQGNTVILRGKHYQITKLCGRYLEHVKKGVWDGVHEEISSAVITVPALFGQTARTRLEQSATEAGFSTVTLLDEPLAAGIAFLQCNDAVKLGGRVLVFDWGGGTLDLALLERQDGTFKIHPELVGGDSSCGGEDLDDTLLDAVSQQMEKAGLKPLTQQPLSAQVRAARAVRRAKVFLSKKTTTVLRFSAAEAPVEMELTRDYLEGLYRPAVEATIEHLLKLLDQCRTAGLFPDQVLLVGGTAQIPLVSRMTLERTGITPITWDHSIEAVSMGAAIRAHEASVPPRQPTGQEPPPLPPSATRQAQEQLLQFRFKKPAVSRAVSVPTQEWASAHLGEYVDEKVCPTGPLLIVRNVGNRTLTDLRISFDHPELTAEAKENLTLDHALAETLSPGAEVVFDEGINLIIAPKCIITVHSGNGWVLANHVVTEGDTEHCQTNPPPFLLWVRSGMFSNHVLVIINVGDDLALGVVVRRGCGFATIAAIPAKQSVEVGWHEMSDDANFQAGDQVAIDCQGYDTIIGVIQP